MQLLFCPLSVPLLTAFCHESYEVFKIKLGALGKCDFTWMKAMLKCVNRYYRITALTFKLPLPWYYIHISCAVKYSRDILLTFKFVNRGSLFKILHRSNQILDLKRRLRMALDVVWFFPDYTLDLCCSFSLRGVSHTFCVAAGKGHELFASQKSSYCSSGLKIFELAGW